MKVKSLSRVQLLVTLWTVAHQAPPSMGFSKQEYLDSSKQEYHFLLQGIFQTQGSNSGLPHVGRLSTVWATRESHSKIKRITNK